MSTLRESLIAATKKPEVYRKALADIPDEIVGMRGRIGGLFVYPWKGTHAVALEEARLGSQGIETVDGSVRDRMAMLVRREAGTHKVLGEYDGERLSQKDTPHLAHIHMSVPYQGILQMSAPAIPQDMFALKFSVHCLRPEGSDVRKILMSGKNPYVLEGEFLPQDHIILRRLRSMLSYFGEKIEDIGLFIPHAEFRRQSDTVSTEDAQTLLSDGSQLHITNATSSRWDMRRFRPNIVLTDLPAWTEDLVGEIRIETDAGEVHVELAQSMPRCPVPDKHPDTGEVKGGPNKWLAQHHPRDANSNITFGRGAHVLHSQEKPVIRKGDPFVITRERSL